MNYAILGATKDMDDNELLAAFKKKIDEYNPDTYIGNKEDAVRISQNIVSAYREIKKERASHLKCEPNATASSLHFDQTQDLSENAAHNKLFEKIWCAMILGLHLCGTICVINVLSHFETTWRLNHTFVIIVGLVIYAISGLFLIEGFRKFVKSIDVYVPISSKRAKKQATGFTNKPVKTINNVRLLQICIVVLAVATAVFAYNSKYNYNVAIDYKTGFEGQQVELEKIKSSSIQPTPEHYKSKYFWERTYVAITTPTGKKYHAIGCQHLNRADSINVYSVSGAKKLGYTPCRDCH